jgi:membrane protease YdiL (CAAX protease family)
MDAINSRRKNLLLIVGLLIAALYFPVIGHLLFAGRPHTIFIRYMSRLFIWSGVLVLYLYAHKVEGNDLLLWKDKKYGFWFYVASVIITYIVILVCMRLSYIPYYYGWREKSTVMFRLLQTLKQNTPLMLFSAITAGITEELICRGYLVPRIEMLVKNRYLPVILSALIFAGNHFAYFSLYELIFTFLFGIVFAIHYQKFRNLKVLMISHGLTDLIAFLSFRDHPTKVH